MVLSRTPLNKRKPEVQPPIFSSIDPGRTLPGQMWIDISGGPGAWVLKVRNDGSANWETLGSATDAIPVINTSDPGSLGAARFWIDSSAGTGMWELKIRNTNDTAWESLASGGVVDLSPLEDRTTDLESQTANLESDVSDLSTTVGGHTTTLGTLGTTVSGHTTSIGDLGDDLDSAVSRIDTLETTAPTIVGSVDPGALGTGRLWVDISAGSTAWALKARNVADDGWEILAQGVIDVAGIDSRLDTAETDIQNAETAITNLTSTVSDQADDIAANVSSISTINSSLTSLDGRLDTAESALTSLDGRIDSLEAASSAPYIAPITNSTGATITAVTHGKGTSPSVTIYRSTTEIDTYLTINGSGDVTWSTSEAISGSIVIL